MTEAEWLACDDPVAMVKLLDRSVSTRKLRLFFMACCQELWSCSPVDGAQVFLELANHFVEASGIPSGITVVRVAAGEAVIDCGASEPLRTVRENSTNGGTEWNLYSAACAPMGSILELLACRSDFRVQAAMLIGSLQHAGLVLARQAELLREVVRGPFRPLVFREIWRSANERTVERLAHTIYEERAFDHLPVLADALEDAGCDSAEILTHCRGPGPHMRGCWLVDQILGKASVRRT